MQHCSCSWWGNTELVFNASCSVLTGQIGGPATVLDHLASPHVMCERPTICVCTMTTLSYATVCVCNLAGKHLRFCPGFRHACTVQFKVSLKVASWSCSNTSNFNRQLLRLCNLVPRGHNKLGLPCGKKKQYMWLVWVSQPLDGEKWVNCQRGDH